MVKLNWRRSRALWFGVSSTALTFGMTISAANAACVTSGSSVTCDASAPNPSRNGAAGTQVSLLSGAIVQVDDPYAGATPITSTISIYSNGQLTTAAGSQIINNLGSAVATGSNATLSLSGSITGNGGTGILLGSNSSLVANQGASIQTVGNGIGTTGAGAQITINGAVRTSGNNAIGIIPGSNGTFGFSLYTASITVGATGSVSTTGQSAHSVVLTGGSSLSVAGTLSATGSGSSAIFYQSGATPSSAVSVDILAGATVSASQAPAITSSASSAPMNLRIAGTVSGPANGTAIALGSGNDTLTLVTGGTVNGLIDGGAGTDTINLTGTGNGTLGSTANIEKVASQSGNWTLGSGFKAASVTYAGSGTTTNNGTIEGTGQVLGTADYQSSATFVNTGTIRSTSGTAGSPAVFINGSASLANSGLIQAAVDGVAFSSGGTFTNSGTITAGGTAFSLFGSSFSNSGTIRSTGGIGAVITGSTGSIFNRTNSGLIEGATIGAAVSTNIVNTGTIRSAGLGVRIDSYAQIDNRAGAVISGDVAAISPSFGMTSNAVIRNAGTINGNVSFAQTVDFLHGTSNNVFYAESGGVLNGNLVLGYGDYLITELAGSGNGKFAGITGTVTANSSNVRFRVRGNAAIDYAPIAGFQSIGYELMDGGTLTLTASAPQTAPLGLAGVGAIDLNTNISTTDQLAIGMSSPTTGYNNSGVATKLDITSRGSISLSHVSANTYPGGAIVLAGESSLLNLGSVSVSDTTATVGVSAVTGGTLVTNNGTISIGGAIGVRGAKALVNTGSITQIAGSKDSIGIIDVPTLTNSGTIQVNGMAYWNGTSSLQVNITNLASGVISGGQTAISVAGSLTLTNAGTISATSGNQPIAIFGSSGSQANITNSGLIRGDIQLTGRNNSIDNSGVIAGNVMLGAGNDSFTLRTGGSVTGTIDGGAGRDAMVLAGTGSGTLGANVNFESLNVQSGTWTLSAASTYANGTTIASGATLVGNAATLTGSIVDNGTLRIDQATDATLAASISGNGLFSKAGAGTLTVGSLANFTGTLQIAAGSLASASAVTIGSGQTISGNGTISAPTVTLGAGGRIAPGASIGTLTIGGNLVQQAGSVYAAEIGATTADRIIVNGSATLQAGAQLAVSGTAGAIGTRYTLLTATGGVTGTYAVTFDATSLTELRLAYSANAITADVIRSRLGVFTVGQTTNERAVATALGVIGESNAAYAAIVAQPSDAVVRAGLGALSGDIHPAMRTAMVRDASLVRNTTLDHAADGEQGFTLWGGGLAGWGHDDGTPGGRGATRTQRDTIGGLVGVRYGLDRFSFGLAGGYSRTKLRLPDHASDGRLKTVHLLGYASGTVHGFRVRATGGYSWVDGRTDRQIAIGSFTDRLRADTDGGILQGSFDVALPLAIGGGQIIPLLGVEGYRTRSDAFSETGGAAALTAGKRLQASAFSRAGFEAKTPSLGAISAEGSLAWVHRLAGEDPTTVASFGGAGGFRVAGAPLSRDAAEASLGLGWAVSQRLRLTASYRGTIGDKGEDNGVRVVATLRF